MTTNASELGPGAGPARRPGPLLIGHRGAPRERPENTLPSFMRALELGADGIELDVHATKDGVVVVHHDEVPRAAAPSGRLTGKRIDALTFDELQGFSVRGMALIPTLAEVLAAVRGRADVFIELKGAGVEAAAVDAIRKSPSPGRCAVHSFDHEAVRRAHAIAPEIRGGILFDRALGDVPAAMRAADALDAWPRWDLIDAGLVAAVHGAGGRVIAWTVNRTEPAAALAALGVDGLCTDHLPLLQQVLRPAALSS
ncbi:MAG TPA: glycerophosphodiester phosphodiesterase family protein [Gemmatimonadaceae bacterium]|nr:glycerophosphodiester phosphodiesterase family protein [Gemmatimonadaceae bacterium]